jgi:hypothetical protein
MLASAIRKVGAGPGDEVLDLACDSLDWTWYPWGEQVVVVSLAEQVHRQLMGRLSIRMSHRPLAEVLREVTRQSGVRIHLDEGVAAVLPARIRQSFTLLADNVTVEEALDEIAIATALTYRVRADGVVLALPDDAGSAEAAQSAAPAQPKRHNAYVAKISVPAAGGEYEIEFLLRESDLSPEANELRKKLIEEANDVIEEALRKRFEQAE